MGEKTPWEEAAEDEGTTDSERALTRLARKAFLTLWSYPNVFTDEGRAGGKGDGKELCDLLVVFGNDVQRRSHLNTVPALCRKVSQPLQAVLHRSAGSNRNRQIVRFNNVNMKLDKVS